jgi:hypothetical protein
MAKATVALGSVYQGSQTSLARFSSPFGLSARGHKNRGDALTVVAGGGRLNPTVTGGEVVGEWLGE